MQSPSICLPKTRRRFTTAIIGIAAAALAALSGLLLPGTARAATQICSNQTGTESGYYYTLWENGTGSACMTYNGSSYSTSWSNIGDFTAGIGWNPGSTNTVNFTSSVSDSSGTALVSVYGWMTNPLVEYYVEENWSGSANGSGTDLGTFTDGSSTYTLREHQQVNQPCITGNSCTFEQYIAVRSSPTSSASVNMANVEAAWRAKGLSVGTMNYETIGSEAYGGGTGSTTINGGASSGGGGGGGGSGSCTATLSADGQGSNYYVLKVAVSGKSSWTVTLNMVSPSVVYSVSGANATYPSEYVAKLTPGSGGNNFTVTISPNGTWTWPSVSCA
jgi:endo-1,4-beta-xylanase